MSYCLAPCCDLDDTPKGVGIQKRRRIQVAAAGPGQGDPRPGVASRSGVPKSRALTVPISGGLVHPGYRSPLLATDPNGKIVAVNVEAGRSIELGRIAAQ